LTITGPVGIEMRLMTAAEALFPGASTAPRGFPLTFIEYHDGVPLTINGVTVTPFLVSHPCDAPPYALRIEADGRTLAFSGDTEWVENLIPASAGSDLFIAECFGYEQTVRYHMSWAILKANLPRITAKKLMLTHMGPMMLTSAASVASERVVIAADGLEIHL